MNEIAERIAKAFHESYERRAPDHGYETRVASSVPWEDVPAENRGLMVAVAEELLERGVIAAGVPVSRPDADWRRAFGEVRGEEGLTLLREFAEAGMPWLANRVLHPFGWTVGLVEDDDEVPVGLGVMRTSDPEGIANPPETEIPARRVFLEAVGRELPPPAEPEPGVLPTACVVCGQPRYRRTAEGAALAPSQEPLTYVQPHELAGLVASVACGNPRCAVYEPLLRLTTD